MTVEPKIVGWTAAENNLLDGINEGSVILYRNYVKSG